MRNLTIYAQKRQTNGYFPVVCFERIYGIWCTGQQKGESFGMYKHTAPEYDNDFIYNMLIDNYEVFSTEKMLGSEIMHEGNKTPEQLKRLIFNY